MKVKIKAYAVMVKQKGNSDITYDFGTVYVSYIDAKNEAKRLKNLWTHFHPVLTKVVEVEILKPLYENKQ